MSGQGNGDQGIGDQGFAIAGAGDLGFTVLRQFASDGTKFSGFIDDYRTGQVGGLPVLGRFDDAKGLYLDGKISGVIVAVGYKSLQARQTVFERFMDQGIPVPSLVHSTVWLGDHSSIEAGAIVMPGCVVDVGATIGKNSVLNLGCIVSHDTSVGAHCFLAPSVAVAGFVQIGARCFLGIGTAVIDNVRLGEDCFVAGGSVVTRDVRPGCRIAGVPAKEMGDAHSHNRS